MSTVPSSLAALRHSAPYVAATSGVGVWRCFSCPRSTPRACPEPGPPGTASQPLRRGMGRASNLLGGRHRIGTIFFLLPVWSSALHFLRGLRFHWPRSSWAAVHRSPTTLLKPSGKRREQPSVADLILPTLNFCKMGLTGDLLKVMASAQSKNRSHRNLAGFSDCLGRVGCCRSGGAHFSFTAPLLLPAPSPPTPPLLEKSGVNSKVFFRG